MNTFPERLKVLRKEKAVSQQKLSDFLGYRYTAVANYESGRNQPSIDTLIRIAEYFGVTVDYLIGKVDMPQRGIELTGKEAVLLRNFQELSVENQKVILQLTGCLILTRELKD